MAEVDADAAARLIEALMTDGKLRERFRRDPVGTCHALGLQDLAEEMGAGAGKAMQTLDLRESRSSLAGVLMAAAVEGMAVWQVLDHADEAGELVSMVLSRVSLPALPDLRGAASGGGPAGLGTTAAGAAAGDEMDGLDGGGGSSASAPVAATAPSAPTPPVAPADAAAPTDPPAATTPADPAAATRPADPPAATTPADPAAATTPADAPASEPGSPTDPPTSASAPEVRAGPGPAGSGGGLVGGADGNGDGARVQGAVPGQPTAMVDPEALTREPNLAADARLRAALRDGTLSDPALRVLKLASEREAISASIPASAPGTLEITAVGGEPVGASNVNARDLAETIGALPGGDRPKTIGTPWSIRAAGFTSAAGDESRLRLVFDDATKAGADGSGDPDAASAVGALTLDGADSAENATGPSSGRWASGEVRGSAPAASSAPAAPAAAVPAAAAEPAAAEAPQAAAPAAQTPRVQGAPPAANRGDTLTMGVPVAAMSAVPESNDSLVLAAQAEPTAQRASTPAAAAADAVPVAKRTDYPGDGAPKAELAAWMATAARKRGLPGELPVMASLVESDLTNIQGGDRDSIGFFQMRTGIWNKGPYAGYPDRPDLQLKWFLDTASTVKQQRLAQGLPVNDASQFGNWIADVERPAEEYRYRYQLRLKQARGLLTDAAERQGSGGSTGIDAAPEPAPVADVERTAPAAQPAEVVATPVPSGDPTEIASRAALQNPKLHFDSVGVADLKAGRIDPRILAVLTKLSEDHDLKISCMRSDHSKFTAGGSISNHFEGRGVDIASVDGQIVNAGSPLARKVAEQLMNLNDRYRPDEIGSPWAIAGPGYFTDGAHQDHLHIGFKTELPDGWKTPAGLLPEAPAPAATPAASVPSDATVVGPVAMAPDTLTLPVPAERAAAPNASDSLSMPVPAVSSSGPAAAGPLAAGADDAARLAASGGTAPAAAEGAQVSGPSAVDSAPAGPAAAVEAAQPRSPAGAAGPRALAAVTEAKKYLGTPYLWGGSSPKTGFDCSGLVQWAYAQQGIRIPRVTYDQIAAPNGKAIDRGHLRAGDLVFFASASGDVHHVGMSLGGDRFIHAPHTGDVVKISNLKEPYFAGQFAGGRRFDAAAPVAPTAGGGSAAGGGPAAPAGAGAGAARAGEPSASPGADAAAPTAVKAAEAARVADEASLGNRDSLLFQALSKQEAASHQNTIQFLAAVQPGEAKRVAEAAAGAGIGTPLAEVVGTPKGALGYPGDGASRAELARWLASQARKHGLPPELPVMAALVESDLRNLNFGDRDSVGFFQMRTQIWNKGDYAGYPDRPELQAKWFIDHALAVKRARLAAGNDAFGRDPNGWGEWVADVERPAERYRGKYQLRLAEARRLLSGR